MVEDFEGRSHLKTSLPEDQVTPEWLFLSRRKFIAGLGAAAAALVLTACTRSTPSLLSGTPAPSFCDDAKAIGSADELGNTLTTCDYVTNYNNFYEISYAKEGMANKVQNFKTSPWSLSIGGLVSKPTTYSVDDLISKYQPQERIYRMRCVEAWSMVIPWIGFPLNKLLTDAQPKPEAKFVRFLSFYDPKQMPGDSSLPFPYAEGLRLDEAMHDLTILATGLYGKPLPAQDGAPIRLVVPWKYGFKSAKSILSIELTADMPHTFWPTLAPMEYGFYANVNPNVFHPRWSQASERRIGGELQRKATLLFNGYDQVGPLYQGMDLSKFF
jgi:methionine sulfoxide reductase catalytic subunit